MSTRQSKIVLTLLMFFPVLILTGCADKTDRYSFWKGDIVNHYYILDMNEQRLHMVEGKPYMIMEYDPINLVPLKVEFGLDEANNVYLPGCEGAIPEPFIASDALPSYAERLGLKGPVALLANWVDVTSATEYEFQIDKGEDFWGHEILYFDFTHVNSTSSMWGEIINESATWGGRVSDDNAFNLQWQFNSNTSE